MHVKTGHAHKHARTYTRTRARHRTLTRASIAAAPCRTARIHACTHARCTSEMCAVRRDAAQGACNRQIISCFDCFGSTSHRAAQFVTRTARHITAPHDMDTRSATSQLDPTHTHGIGSSKRQKRRRLGGADLGQTPPCTAWSKPGVPGWTGKGTRSKREFGVAGAARRGELRTNQSHPASRTPPARPAQPTSFSWPEANPEDNPNVGGGFAFAAVPFPA